MGSSASKQVPRGLVISFDALGTLYRFKKPAPQQFLSVARQCGYKGNISEEELRSSYQTADKYMNNQHPNYGKKTLSSTAEWWAELARHALRVPNTQKVPQSLGPSLYNHFSSSAAYELYRDVKPFLQRIHHLRRTLNTRTFGGPTLALGVIANSDDGVRRILHNLGLSVGTSGDLNRMSWWESTKFAIAWSWTTHPDNCKTPMYDIWSLRHDFDFLATSYEDGYQKPHRRIFSLALSLAHLNIFSRAEQLKQLTQADLRRQLKWTWEVADHLINIDLAWIHVGDDYDKDYVGATKYRNDAFYLVREGGGKEPVEGARTITSLTELLPITNIMVHEKMLGSQSSIT